MGWPVCAVIVHRAAQCEGSVPSKRALPRLHRIQRIDQHQHVQRQIIADQPAGENLEEDGDGDGQGDRRLPGEEETKRQLLRLRQGSRRGRFRNLDDPGWECPVHQMLPQRGALLSPSQLCQIWRACFSIGITDRDASCQSHIQ